MRNHELLKSLYHRGEISVLEGCHIEISLPIGVGNLDDFDIQPQQLLHVRHNGNAKPLRYQPCDYLILMNLLGNSRAVSDFFKQTVNDDAQTRFFRKINMWIGQGFCQINGVTVRQRVISRHDED